jgi:2-keto-4-pentenoate hydratase/2-oxohepta-3-ene-1,7-dioic acid hydratase in catechol pathway
MTAFTAAAPADDPRCAALPVRPGKIVAVHLSYVSRADQRGRRPAAPSYFFKPSSSVAASGGAIERPAGTELLAFEGEIALVIGETARRVSIADAWGHVAWVTAANDFGLYDLRAADKGSNARSKGGDGFTPIGPRLIDARAIDPAALRLRTWVNGEPAQDDTTAGLLFPLAQFVADLSQHFTLEPGDVILTGTPAGSSRRWCRAITASMRRWARCRRSTTSSATMPGVSGTLSERSKPPSSLSERSESKGQRSPPNCAPS